MRHSNINLYTKSTEFVRSCNAPGYTWPPAQAPVGCMQHCDPLAAGGHWGAGGERIAFATGARPSN